MRATGGVGTSDVALATPTFVGAPSMKIPLPIQISSTLERAGDRLAPDECAEPDYAAPDGVLIGSGSGSVAGVDALVPDEPEPSDVIRKCELRQAVLDLIRSKKLDRIPDHEEKPDSYIETDPIVWNAETDDGDAVTMLASYGWNEDRIRQELTLALSEEGRDLVRVLLEMGGIG
jgi:hypothetical protein